MRELILKEDRNHDDVMILQDFLPIIRSLIKSHDMLTWLLSVDGFVSTLLLCSFVKNNSIIIDSFTYLTIICGTYEGYNQVINAFDDFVIFSQERVRFQSVISLLTTTSDSEVVITLLVFFNTLIKNAFSIAQRLAVYYETITHCRFTLICFFWIILPFQIHSSRNSLVNMKRSIMSLVPSLKHLMKTETPHM